MKSKWTNKWTIIEKEGKFCLYRKPTNLALAEDLLSTVDGEIERVCAVFLLPLAFIFVLVLKIYDRKEYIEERYQLLHTFDTLDEAIEYRTITEVKEKKELEETRIYNL